MSYYLREYSIQLHHSSTEVWNIEDDSAVRVGISGAPAFKADPGETIWQALQRQTPWFGPSGESPFHKAILNPGEFYRRMARPSDQHPAEAPGWNPGAAGEQDFIAIEMVPESWTGS